MSFKRVVLIILDSVGVGALPDAKTYGDLLSYNTLGNIAKKTTKFSMPTLEALGIGNLTKIKGIHILIAAFRIIVKQFPDTKLLMALNISEVIAITYP